jgi:hypothetical protein
MYSPEFGSEDVPVPALACRLLVRYHDRAMSAAGFGRRAASSMVEQWSQNEHRLRPVLTHKLQIKWHQTRSITPGPDES